MQDDDLSEQQLVCNSICSYLCMVLTSEYLLNSEVLATFCPIEY